MCVIQSLYTRIVQHYIRPRLCLGLEEKSFKPPFLAHCLILPVEWSREVCLSSGCGTRLWITRS